MCGNSPWIHQRIDSSSLDDGAVHTPKGIGRVDVKQGKRRQGCREDAHIEGRPQRVEWAQGDIRCYMVRAETVVESLVSLDQAEFMAGFQRTMRGFGHDPTTG